MAFKLRQLRYGSVAKEGAKSFLLEMPIIGEGFGQAFAPHRRHRNAIDQTVSFIRPRGVKLQSSTEGFAALWDDLNCGSLQ